MAEAVTLPRLLEICLKSLLKAPASKLNSEQKSVLGATFFSSLNELSVSVPPTFESAEHLIGLSLQHLNKQCGLLRIFLENLPPPSDTLSETLKHIATTCIVFLDFNDAGVRTYTWLALSLIMQIDFDIVLGMDQLASHLQNATFDFLEVLMVTNFKIRNGVEFVKQWSRMVNNASMDSEWKHDKLAKLSIIQILR
jgi:hypothetical protein